MKQNKLLMVLLVTLLGLSAVMVSTAAPSHRSDVMVDVNVFFDGDVDTETLTRAGARINHQFTSFEAVNALVPSRAIEKLGSDPAIAGIEINTKVSLYEDSLDWGVDRVDAEIVWGATENAVDVTTSTCGTSVKVAVIDTGVDYEHPDLAPNYAGGYDFVNNDADPDDDHYHGTHVSGTIAAADDEPGALSGSLIGVAPCIELYGVKVLDSGGSGTAADVAAGIEWAADNGMDIASLSLGSSSPSSTIQSAGQYAYSQGVVLVAASGNDGSSVGYPAAYPEFIAVGATDINDNVASFSNFGPELEISAPGVDIESTTPLDASGGFFGASPEYDTLSGTSMATPHVSAVAALVLSKDNSLSNNEVRDVLTSTAEDVNGDGYDESYGYGIVDAETAVAAVGGTPGDTTPPAQVTGLSATAVSSTQIDLDWNDNSEADLDHYNVYRDGVFIGTTAVSSYSDTGLDPSTTYTYEVSAEDTSGNEGALSASASATTDAGSGTPAMYVSSISFVEQFEGWWFWGNYYTYATITVLDGSGSPLQGVTVAVTLTRPSGSTSSGSSTTDANGEVVFRWQSNACGTYHLEVTSLSLTGYDWDQNMGITGADFTNC